VNKFGVILADPPWSYTQYRDAANGAAKANYSCLAAKYIQDIPVASWARKDAVLALWCTGPKIDEGVDLMRHWGFQHKTMIPWIKNSPKTKDLATGPGIWWMGNSEYIMFGVRKNPGNFKSRRGCLGYLHGLRHNPLIWKRVSERRLISPKAKQHSRKPDNLQEYLETFEGPYLELFARRWRPGWTTWGLDLGHMLTREGVRSITYPDEVADILCPKCQRGEPHCSKGSKCPAENMRAHAEDERWGKTSH